MMNRDMRDIEIYPVTSGTVTPGLLKLQRNSERVTPLSRDMSRFEVRSVTK